MIAIITAFLPRGSRRRHLVLPWLVCWHATGGLLQELLPEVVAVDGADVLIQQVGSGAHHVEIHRSGKV